MPVSGTPWDPECPRSSKDQMLGPSEQDLRKLGRVYLHLLVFRNQVVSNQLSYHFQKKEEATQPTI